jgi:hypothetical protein
MPKEGLRSNYLHINTVIVMKKALLISALLSFSTLSNASDIMLSPEIKLGAYRGAGLQVGATDTLGFDAVFFDYARTNYVSNNYDENIDSYRIGFQQMFSSTIVQGFQAGLGVAQYDGSKRGESRTASGVSIGAAYVYQATPNFGLKTGFDIHVFDHQKTYIPSDILSSWNLGFTLTF